MSTRHQLRSPGGRITLSFHAGMVQRIFWLLAATGLAGLIYLSVGSTLLSPMAVVRTLIDPASSDHAFVVNTLRLPRGVLALMVGASLGVSGAILQHVVRNPLASPDIIGISDGAAVGAVLFLAWLTGTLSLVWLPPVAITTALVTALLIYGLSWQQGVMPTRMILVGIALAAALKAVTTLVLVMSPLSTTVQSYIWLTGSLYGADWRDVQGLLPWLIVLLPVTLLLARPLDMLALQDQQSMALGLSVARYRALLLACSVGLAGSAVAFAGGIGFVGLIAPHLARRLTGRTIQSRILGAALLGSLIVLVADLIGRYAFMPQDLPAGIFVSGVGAPFFIYLLCRRA